MVSIDEGIVSVTRLTPNVLSVELFLWRDDGTVRWWPSLHGNTIDTAVIERQVRAHHMNASREW